jgi:hypothetical protein
MLQTVYEKERTPQASSLYCRWICVEHPQGQRLLAVWIDSQMRAFENEAVNAGQPNDADASLEVLPHGKDV